MHIVDYRTKWSGISAATLAGVSTTFEQVQVAVLRVVTRETMLVGHSLENDLRALKVLSMNTPL